MILTLRKNFIVFLFIILGNTNPIFPDKKSEIKEIPIPASIQSGSTGEFVDSDMIFKKLENYDVLIFGEEHDDVVGHRIRLYWFQKIAL
ncbi:hypothetical protein ISU91_21170, partial [Leptospira borgpetersenii serovar Hardjo-bovis]|nr:hypothetical protein [Leptospira borgpetersenii serovar Hardjo-bovis]